MSARRPEAVVIVGCGRAAEIHARAYRHLGSMCRVVGVVDPRSAARDRLTSLAPGARSFPSVEEALQALGPNIVADICVPSPANPDVVQVAAAHGVRRFMVEKPLAWSHGEAIVLERLLEGREALYMDTYSSSNGVDALARRLAELDEHGGTARSLRIRFTKDRRADTACRRGFAGDRVPSGWLLEGPHMVSIAVTLAGPVVSVTDVTSTDMTLPSGRALTGHGGGTATLVHASGVQTKLDLDLCTGRAIRDVRVELHDGSILSMELPASGDSRHVSRLVERDREGHQTTRTFADRPLEQCVHDAMTHFVRGAEGSTPLSRGVEVCRILPDLPVIELPPASHGLTAPLMGGVQ